METVINFINNTDNSRNARYVVFKKNLAADAQGNVNVLKFIDEIGFGESTSFALKDERWVAGWWTETIHQGAAVAMAETRSELMALELGERFTLNYQMETGIEVQKDGYASNRHEIEVVNSPSSIKAIHGMLYQSREVSSETLVNGEMVPTSYRPTELLGSVLVEPGQQGRFRFDDILCLGVTWYRSTYPLSPGNYIIPLEEVYHITEIPLLGITATDIIASGGGPDDERLPVSFGLNNVRRT